MYKEAHMIALDNVYKTYSTGVSALNGISLKIRKGEFVFIVEAVVPVRRHCLNCF